MKGDFFHGTNVYNTAGACLLLLNKMGLTQMIVSDPLSIRYLTGVWVDPYERLYALYLRTDGKHRFFLK